MLSSFFIYFKGHNNISEDIYDQDFSEEYKCMINAMNI